MIFGFVATFVQSTLIKKNVFPWWIHELPASLELVQTPKQPAPYRHNSVSSAIASPMPSVSLCFYELYSLRLVLLHRASAQSHSALFPFTALIFGWICLILISLLRIRFVHFNRGTAPPRLSFLLWLQWILQWKWWNAAFLWKCERL